MLEYTIIAVLLTYIVWKIYSKNKEIDKLKEDKALLEYDYDEFEEYEKKADKYNFLLKMLDNKSKRKFYNKYKNAND